MNRKTTPNPSQAPEWTIETAMQHVAEILEKRVSWDISFQLILSFLASIVHVKCEKCGERLFVHVLTQMKEMTKEEPYLTPKGYARSLKMSLAKRKALLESINELDSLIGIFVGHQSLDEAEDWAEIFGNKK